MYGGLLTSRLAGLRRYRHPLICDRVKALFEKHGIEYDVRPYTECMRVTYANLWAVGHTHEHHH